MEIAGRKNYRVKPESQEPPRSNRLLTDRDRRSAVARMKRSGMRRHIKSGQAIPRFRALQKSGFLASARAIIMENRGGAAKSNFAVENLAIAA
ncbi:MAG: hypothetical protein OXC26_23645 [Albidovulum sp.]|nr:hypothetical protein [Albidovulum sp.]